MEKAPADGGTGVGNSNKQSKAPGKRPAKPKAPKPKAPKVNTPEAKPPAAADPSPTTSASKARAAAAPKAATKPSASAPPTSSAASSGYKPSKPAAPKSPESASATTKTAPRASAPVESATTPIADEATVDAAPKPAPPKTVPARATVEAVPTKRGIPNSALALAAVVIGLGVGFLTYGFGSAADRTPTARVQMVLDEDQTGWPFYAAVQEEAVAQVEASETQQAVRAALSQPDAATELWVDRPGDLSVFAIYATAESDEVALEFASAAAAELQARNVSQRRSGEEATLAALQTQLAELEARVAESSAALDGSDEDSERVIAREDLRIASADRADTEQAITDLEIEIAGIAPAFRPAAPAAIQSTGSRSILAAIASAAAAAALTLLALSFVAPNRDNS